MYKLIMQKSWCEVSGRAAAPSRAACGAGLGQTLAQHDSSRLRRGFTSLLPRGWWTFRMPCSRERGGCCSANIKSARARKHHCRSLCSISPLSPGPQNTSRRHADLTPARSVSALMTLLFSWVRRAAARHAQLEPCIPTANAHITYYRASSLIRYRLPGIRLTWFLRLIVQGVQRRQCSP
jgi:hypothetical protein